MRICCVSDTHGLESSITKHMPQADMVIHAGDFTRVGKDHEIITFLEWWNNLDYKFKCLVGGNHDWGLQLAPSWFESEFAARMKGAGKTDFYLNDSGVEIEGIKFYGSPWTPRFFDWAFNLREHSPANDNMAEHWGPSRVKYTAEECWGKIPHETNVLITHGPAEFIGDELEGGGNVGCPVLADYLSNMGPNLKLHVSGHVHSGYGQYAAGYSWPRGIGRAYNPYIAVNAAVCTEQYRPKNKPIVVEINI